MVFVDTGGWYAVAALDDPNHPAATAWFRQNREPLFTTNYVVDETLTLFRSKGQNNRALMAGESFFSGTEIQVYRITGEDERAAWQIFRDFADKGWSFTDCTSKVVIDKLEIATAFAFDQHFRQFGTVAVVP